MLSLKTRRSHIIGKLEWKHLFTLFRMRDKKVAEERMRQIEEQNARVNAAKFK